MFLPTFTFVCGRFERPGVHASCRAPNSIYQTHWPSHRCSGAGGVFNSRWRCVSVVTQRSVWTPLSKKSSNISLVNQARWSRRPLLVISTVVNNDFFLNWRSLPDLGLLTKSKFDERLYMFRRRHCNRLSSTLEQRLRISSALMPLSIRRVHHEKIGWERRLLSSRSRFSQSAKP